MFSRQQLLLLTCLVYCHIASNKATYGDQTSSRHLQSRLPEQLSGGGSTGRGQVCATSAPKGGDETGPSAGLWICCRQRETSGGPLSHTR